MATLKDIAEFANVSISTVSRVLNEKGNISRETTDKVMRVCEELLYKPGVAQQKLSGMCYKVALLIPNSNEFYNDDPSFSVDINSLKDEIEKLGCKVILSTNTGRLDKSAIAYNMITRKEVDGVVVCDPYDKDECIDQLVNYNIPYVVTNGIFLDKNYNYVDYNNYEGAKKAIQYLHELGHRNIGILSGPEDHMVSINRMQGCMDAVKELDFQINENAICSGAFSINSGYECAKKTLESNKNLTAIFAFSDHIAMGAMKAIKEKGLQIPDDMSIMGFDNMALTEFIEPSLTTVRRFNYSISMLIAQAVYNLMTNGDIEKVCISLKTELVIRNSCKKI